MVVVFATVVNTEVLVTKLPIRKGTAPTIPFTGLVTLVHPMVVLA